MTESTPIAPAVPFTDALDELAEKERKLNEMLESGARALRRPADIVWRLGRLAGQCRDHARILRRHRREFPRPESGLRDKDVGPVEGWRSGPSETLERATDAALVLAKDCASVSRQVPDLYLKKYLEILAREHRMHCAEIGRALRHLRDRV